MQAKEGIEDYAMSRVSKSFDACVILSTSGDPPAREPRILGGEDAPRKSVAQKNKSSFRRTPLKKLEVEESRVNLTEVLQ